MSDNLNKEYLRDLMSNKDAPGECSAYETYYTVTTPEGRDTVNEDGKQRNRKYACLFTLNVMPGMDAIEPGQINLPLAPNYLIDAEDLDDLKARLHFEVDKACEIAELSLENPEKFQSLVQEIMQERQMAELQASFADREGVQVAVAGDNQSVVVEPDSL